MLRMLRLSHLAAISHPSASSSHLAISIASMAVACLFALCPSNAFAFDKACRAHYQQKAYLQAATCFQGLLAAIDKKPELGQLAPTLKQKFLRDAAVSYNRAADASQAPNAKAFHKEQAVAMLDKALGSPFCQVAGRCTNHRTLRKRFVAEIQYGRLAIYTNQSKVTFVVTGYQYNKEASDTFNYPVRPGKYEILMKAKGTPDKRRQVEIKPSISVTITMESPEIKIKHILVAKKIPPLVLAGYIGGGALVLGGIALAVVGYINQSSLNNCRQNAACAQEATTYDREFDQAGAFIAIGYVTTAGGLAFLGGTALAQVFANQNPANRPPPQLSNSTSLGSFGWTQ